MGFFMVSYIVLLGAALFHGLYGLRNILFELGPGAGREEGPERRADRGRRRPVRRSARGRHGPPAPWRGRCRRVEERR